MNEQLHDVFRSAGHDLPPSTVDLDAAVRRARVLRARRRRVRAAATLTTTAAVVAGALALAGVLPGTNAPAPSVGTAAPGPASAPTKVKNTPTEPMHVKNTPIEDFPVITAYDQVQWPLYAYLPTYAQENLMHEAEDTLTIRCIARFGITPTYPRLPLERGATMRGNIAPRYGVADLASAKANGYGPYADMEKGGTDAFKLAYQPSNFETQVAYNVKLDGTPADGSIRDEDGNPIPPMGCARQDNTEIYGPNMTWDDPPVVRGPGNSQTIGGTSAELLAKLAANSTWSYRSDAMALEMIFDVASEQARKDPRTKQAEALWSQCMADKGYHYRSTSAASNHFNSPVTEEQISTATDDVKCKLSTNYLGINAGIAAEYQEVLISEHRDMLERFTKELQDVLANAQQIVAQG